MPLSLRETSSCVQGMSWSVSSHPIVLVPCSVVCQPDAVLAQELALVLASTSAAAILSERSDGVLDSGCQTHGRYFSNATEERFRVEAGVSGWKMRAVRCRAVSRRVQ